MAAKRNPTRRCLCGACAWLASLAAIAPLGAAPAAQEAAQARPGLHAAAQPPARLGPASAAGLAGFQAPPAPAPGRIEAPQDWDPVGRHVLYLLQESDNDFALLRGEQVNEHMWLSTHYIGSPLRPDDPVPPSVVVLQGYTAWFHGTPLAHGTRRQMTNELLSYADDIERATAGAMEREDIDDMYVRFSACALKSDKYVLLSNLPRPPEGEGEDPPGDAGAEAGAAPAPGTGTDVHADADPDAADEYEVTLMVGRQPGLC